MGEAPKGKVVLCIFILIHYSSSMQFKFVSMDLFFLFWTLLASVLGEFSNHNIC